LLTTEFKGKTVFVTGANSGIGYAQAESFLKKGAHVFAIDIKDDQLVDLKNKYGGYFSYIIADVANKQAVEKAVAQAIMAYDKIDILLNTAGILDAMQKH